MSRILRRPMFRGGGKVSSYGNGIASGLADGGRVNLRVGGNPLSNRALVNLGGAGGAPTQSVMNTGGNILNKNVGRMSGMATKGANLLKSPVFSEAGIMQGLKKLPALGDKIAKYGTNLIKRFPAISYGLAGEYVTRPQDVDKVIYEQEGYGPIEGRIRQVLDPTYMSKMKKVYEQGYNEDGELNAIINKQIKDGKDPALEAAEDNPNKEIVVNDEGEPTLTKKERLEKAAKEYEDILGAGIKRDSIFDAMVEGGTRLLAGEGYAAALNAANKELDPIQNIKTASRKLALEEDIAIRKARAVAASKQTEFTRRAAAMRAAGRSDEDIARMAEGIKPKDKADYIADAKGSATTGLTLWVKDNVPNLKSLVDKKVDPSTLEDGIHYIPELFTLITIKDKVIEKSERLK